MPTRDVRLGRIGLVTLAGDPVEMLGDALETVGASPVPGGRRPRPFRLSLPVYGAHNDADMYTVGLRMRRQLRSLMENHEARLRGLYFQWLQDTELNAWLMVGSGELAYDEAGIAFASFKLELADCFVIAKRITHRQAKRLEMYDRRLITTPRDILKTVYATDFSNFTTYGQHFLDARSAAHTDFTLNGSPAVTWPSPRYSVYLNQISYFITNKPGMGSYVHGSVAAYDQPEASEGVCDALILDRRGFTSPTYTTAGDRAPQDTYGWEEVYGSQYPLTSGDVPVLENGHVRVRWNAARTSLVLSLYSATTLTYVEQGSITFWNKVSVWNQMTTLVSAAVYSWTPDKAVVRINLLQASTFQMTVYVTLERGWAGPRIEAYGSQANTSTPLAMLTGIRYSPSSAAAARLTTHTKTQASGDPGSTWNDNQFTSAILTTDEPWFSLQSVGVLPSANFAVVRAGSELRTFDDTAAYGSTRKAVQVGHAGTGSSYADVRIEYSVPGYTTFQYGALYEAETYMNAAGTRSLVVDASASPGSGNSAVQDTQTSEAANSVIVPAGTLDTVFDNTYAVWARVACTAGSSVVSARAYFGGTSVGTATHNATTYAWIKLGEAALSGSVALNVAIWRSSGSGNAKIDQVMLQSVDDTSWLTGPRNLAAFHLTDSRAIPTMVARGLT